MRNFHQKLAVRVLSGCIAIGLLPGCSETSPPPSEINSVQPTPADQPEPQELDLSRDLITDIVNESDGGELVDPNILPELVDRDPLSKRVKVKGKVLTDKEALQLKDSIDGVELELEIKTK